MNVRLLDNQVPIDQLVDHRSGLGETVTNTKVLVNRGSYFLHCWIQVLFNIQYRLLFHPPASLQRGTGLTALVSGGKGRRDHWR